MLISTHTMLNTREEGKIGEELAIAHLRKAGYEIVQNNWHLHHLEIDIVARHQGELVFVEVKLRHSDEFGDPESFVTRSKQKLLVRAANYYIEQQEIEAECRFDVIGILAKNGQYSVHHIVNAFSPIEH